MVVVRHDLADSHAGRGDFTVDQERRNARILGLLHGGNRGISARVIKDDRLDTRRDGAVEQLGLLVGIIIMHQRHDLIAQLFGLGSGPVGFGFEERVVWAWRDDGDGVGRWLQKR